MQSEYDWNTCCPSLSFQKFWHKINSERLQFGKTIIMFYSCTQKKTHTIKKKGQRKVQGVPQSQTAALTRPQEEEETDKSKQAQTEQTYEKHSY